MYPNTSFTSRRSAGLAISALLAGSVVTLLPINASPADASVRCDRAFSGTARDDTLRGDDRANRMCARAGDDLVRARGGSDTVFGGYGHDQLYSGPRNDSVWGGDGVDAIDGARGADFHHGELGDDSVTGGPGPDTLYGGEGNDFLCGGDGDDYIDLGSTDSNYQYASSGPGNDTIVADYGWSDDIYCGDGVDYVYIDDPYVDYTDASCEHVIY